MPKVNFQGVQTEFVPMPDANYGAVLTGWKFEAESKSSGEPYVVLEFTINEAGDFQNRKAWRNYSLQPQSLWALKRTLIRLGCDPEILEAAIDLDDLMPDMMGSECVLKIGSHTYEGQVRNDIKDIMSADVFSGTV